MSDVSLTIERGEFVALVGPSGSGKSTLLNSIGCLDTPTSGKVRIEGVDVGTLDGPGRSRLRAERLGFVFQSFNLIPVFTAFENIEFALAIQGARQSSEIAARVTRMLELLGLSPQARRRPAELSGG